MTNTIPASRKFRWWNWLLVISITVLSIVCVQLYYSLHYYKIMHCISSDDKQFYYLIQVRQSDDFTETEKIDYYQFVSYEKSTYHVAIRSIGFYGEKADHTLDFLVTRLENANSFIGKSALLSAFVDVASNNRPVWVPNHLNHISEYYDNPFFKKRAQTLMNKGVNLINLQARIEKLAKKEKDPYFMNTYKCVIPFLEGITRHMK